LDSDLAADQAGAVMVMVMVMVMVVIEGRNCLGS
jgi:hypothetical protein